MYLPNKLQKSPLNPDTQPSEHFPVIKATCLSPTFVYMPSKLQKSLLYPDTQASEQFPLSRSHVSPRHLCTYLTSYRSLLCTQTLSRRTFLIIKVTSLSSTLVHLPNKLQKSPLYPDTQPSEHIPSTRSHVSPWHLCTYLTCNRSLLCTQTHSCRHIFRHQGHTSLPSTCVPT